nr:uncharacterized protein LOC118044446 [Populus alba]
MASDFENPNCSELTTNSACVESESSHRLASEFENPNSNELPTEASESSYFSTTNNQNPNELMSNLAYDGTGLHHSMATNFGNPNSDELISSSSYDGSGLLHSMPSNYEIQYPNELIVNSAYNGIEQSHYMASDSENQYVMETTYVSPYENLFTASDLEDPLSPLQPEGETSPSMEMPFQFTNCLLDSACENQNIDKETDISAPDEGERSSPTVMPLDFENRNPWGKIDMSTLEDDLLPEFPQLSPELLAELEAFLELDDSLNPLPQPPASTSTEEVPNYTGIGSVSY